MNISEGFVGYVIDEVVCFKVIDTGWSKNHFSQTVYNNIVIVSAYLAQIYNSVCSSIKQITMFIIN